MLCGEFDEIIENFQYHTIVFLFYNHCFKYGYCTRGLPKSNIRQRVFHHNYNFEQYIDVALT